MRPAFRTLFALLFVAAGINHFWHPAPYLAIMPPWLPAHALLVALSGVAEIVLGVLLLFPRTQRVAAWGIILLLIAVFPANVQMMLNYRAAHHPYFWGTVLRLPLQVVLIWWASRYTRKNVDRRMQS